MKKLIVILLVALSISSAAQKNQYEIVNEVLKDTEKFMANEFAPDSVVTTNPLGSFSESDLARRYEFNKKQYERLTKIDASQLSFDENINLELLTFDFRDEVLRYENKLYYQTILSDEGFHTSLAHRASRSYSNKQQIERYLATLKAIPLYIGQHIELTRKGLALGISQPTIALKGFEATYNTHVVDSYDKSLFWKPFTQKPASINDNDWKTYTEEGKKLIEQSVVPSYKKVKTFFETEYFQKTRKTLGASNYPNGKKAYADLVQYYTTMKITPEAVYTIGTQEVERIKKEMQLVLDEVQFKGSIKDFIDKIRNDPKFYATTPEQLLKEASYIAKKIDGKLPLLFGKLPRQPYGVEPVPDYLAPAYTGGRYSGAPINSRRAGAYWVNTYNLPARTLYTLEALTLHEAVPGHHLQISLTQELENLPRFRRNFYVNAFGEGWGLYSEYLGYELGLYKDPYSKFGRLTYEMWRACRLVIDVGIHDKNWTRDQAVNFLADNTALSLHEVNTEINRYICWPGQALAYKMGEITIKRLRKKAEDDLKEKFDIRKFHDMVLSQGTVTMAILEKMVDKFIEAEKAGLVVSK